MRYGKTRHFGQLRLSSRRHKEEAHMSNSEPVGVMYVAFGAPYLAMALTSIASLRAFNALNPVCVVTNVSRTPPEAEWWRTLKDFHWIFIDDATYNNRHVKTDIYRYSPFYKTLYLDCDTLVLSNIGQISFFLDHFDILLRHINSPVMDSHKFLFDGKVRLGECGAFNSGVVGFRKNENVKRFFSCWSERFKLHGSKRDQPALVEAIYHSNVRLLPIPEQWNHGDAWRLAKQKRDDVIIWHYKSRMDRHLESYITRATTLFSEASMDVTLVEKFIRDRRALRGYGGLGWLLKTLVSEVRGPLSRLPERRLGQENWNGLFAVNAIRSEQIPDCV